MNDRLRAFGLPFVDFSAAYETADGAMRPELSDSTFHVQPARSEPVVAALRAIGLSATFVPPPVDFFQCSVIYRRGRWLRALRRQVLSPARSATRPLRRWIAGLLRQGVRPRSKA